MSEQESKKERAVIEIQKEYTEVCAKVGDAQYRRHCVDKDIALLNEQLQELNFEAIAAHRREQEAKAAAETSVLKES